MTSTPTPEPRTVTRGAVRTTVLAACALLLSAPLLAGCGGSADKGSAHGPAVSPTAPPTGAVKDLTRLRCRAVGGVWRADGTLVNSDKTRHTYDVVLAVIDPKTSHVLGERDLTVAVPAGKSKPFHAGHLFKGRAAHAQCVPRVTLAD
jgi:transposase InsO family protein